jgi:hypothetical protein
MAIFLRRGSESQRSISLVRLGARPLVLVRHRDLALRIDSDEVIGGGS